MNIQTFNYSVDLLQAILWQYNDAERLESLLSQKQDWYNEEQTDFWSDWYNNVFNLVTADEFGLAVWCIILEVPYFIYTDSNTGPIWGFGPGSDNENFTHGNFTSVGGNQIILTPDEQRFLLRLRYFNLTSRLDIVSINTFLDYLSKDSACPYTGTITVLDGLNMTITYVLDCSISKALKKALTDYDVWPRPATVGLLFVDLTRTPWGFGQYRQNFVNGNFVDS